MKKHKDCRLLQAPPHVPNLSPKAHKLTHHMQRPVRDFWPAWINPKDFVAHSYLGHVCNEQQFFTLKVSVSGFSTNMMFDIKDQI